MIRGLGIAMESNGKTSNMTWKGSEIRDSALEIRSDYSLWIRV